MLDEQELMRRVASGDQAAFGEIVHRCLPRLLAVARRYTGAGHEAEDIVQEAFTRLWVKAPGWELSDGEVHETGRRIARVYTWLYQVVSNLCIDRCRRQRMDDLDSVAEPADDRPDAEQAHVDRDRIAHIRAAIDRLPERQRMVLMMCFFDGMSNTEAAAIMELSVGAVESLLVRARRQLRTELAEFARDELGIKDQ